MKNTEAIQNLQALFRLLKTKKVYIVIERVSRSGLTRWLRLYIYDKKNDYLKNITYEVSKALDWRFSNKYNALEVEGVGLNIPFATVYHLSHLLFRKGYYLKHQVL